MANTFKGLTERSIGTSATSIQSYTAPSGGISTVIGLTLANVAAVSITVSVRIFDGVNYTHIVKNAPIPVGSSLVAVGGNQKVVLNDGDALFVTSSTASSVDAIMSVLEIV